MYSDPCTLTPYGVPPPRSAGQIFQNHVSPGVVMRRTLVFAPLFLAASLASAQNPPAGGGRGRGGGRGTAIQPGEQCPPGTTEIRPRSCMAPEFTPPSIVDYRPHSTLKVPEHKVPR